MLSKPRIDHFSPNRLINSMKHEHSCKILYKLYVYLDNVQNKVVLRLKNIETYV